jgi:DNA mismatch repair protein MutS
MNEPTPEPGCDRSELTGPGFTGADISVLSGRQTAAPPADVNEPACLADLNLDQLARSVIAGREEYDLRSFFYARLASPAQAEYRHAVFRDLERPEMRSVADSFAEDMRVMRDCLAQARALHHRLQKSLLYLEAALVYCQAVESLESGLSAAGPASAGMRAFTDYLVCHLTSAAHSGLREDARRIEDSLVQIRYTLHIRGNRVTVGSYEQEADFSDDVRATFEKFADGDAGIAERRPEFPASLEVDHVEAGILERVAALFPEPFADLTEFFNERQGFADPVIGRFDREIQFYLAYLDYVRPVQAAGLAFCYPRLSEETHQTVVSDTFDLVLAVKLAASGQPVVCNDIRLSGAERLLAVTGPNQAGKTTYARAFGQVHYLAGLGCPVPGTNATLRLPDQIFTHFDREDIETRSGKLQDDLIRLRAILDSATSGSVIILNEIFTSTTVADALGLSTRLAERVTALGCRCVWVTFLDEVSRHSPETVSVVAVVNPDDPAVRTFRLERRAADEHAYAHAVARQHGLGYEQVRARIMS